MTLALAKVRTNRLADGTVASSADMIGLMYIINMSSVRLKIAPSCGIMVRAVLGRCVRSGVLGYVPLEVLDIDEGSYEAVADEKAS